MIACIHVCMYACAKVRMNESLYACMYVCMDIGSNGRTDGRMMDGILCSPVSLLPLPPSPTLFLSFNNVDMNGG